MSSDQEQVDTFSVTSGGGVMYRGGGGGGLMDTGGGGAGQVSGGASGSGGSGRLYLTPAQMALQQQLKSKHAELSRRIALQQAELLRFVLVSNKCKQVQY